MKNLKSWIKSNHSIPFFQAEKSRSHTDVPLYKLALQSEKYNLLKAQNTKNVKNFVQFMGFPRSGHSLIGSLLDAHPETIVSHELDTMGLIKKGFSERLIYGLIQKNSSQFTENGRYWNGYAYVVPNQPHGSSKNLKVIGDKKGDWAVRWYGKEAGLLDAARKCIKATPRWILVTRHPLDNIATMSLRQNRKYDKLRISLGKNKDFQSELKKQQAAEEIASGAKDEIIDDYENLCRIISKMEKDIPAEEFTHVVYEEFCLNPEKELRKLCEFLEIKPDESYLKDSASIVRASLNKTRNQISWTDDQLDRVSAIIDQHSFLQNYKQDLIHNG